MLKAVSRACDLLTEKANLPSKLYVFMIGTGKVKIVYT
jgi:hypothetical protein